MAGEVVRAALAQARAASRVEGRIAVGTMASGAEIAIPFVAVKGNTAGRCLWINGQVHGNEINGILAALDFINAIDPATLAGSIVVTSTANPLALDARRKAAPQDDNDLDQTFPGRASGFTTERMAHALFEEIKAVRPDLLINMHTMSGLFESRPYAVYKVHPNGKVDERTLLRFIAPFRPSVACLMSVAPGKGELLGNIAGALDYQLLEAGVPAFMIELGAGTRAEPQYIEQGVAGFRDVCRQLGMLAGAPERPPKLRRVTKRAHVMFTHGGFFRAARAAGEVVRAGEKLGEVMNVHGKVVEAMSLPYDHVIIGIRRDPVVHTGDRFGFVALAWEEVDVA